MIKQKETKTITGSYTTTPADCGYRIICNSAIDFTITLHSATNNFNFDMDIFNIGLGVVTCGEQTISQYSHAHVGNNMGNSWVVAIGGGSSMTKAKIEAILTGEITSHTHADNILTGIITPTTSTVGTIGQFYLDTVAVKLYQCTAINMGIYTWTEVGGNSYELPQATELILGGIKAKVKTTETSEIAIDTVTGKLYSVASSSSGGNIDGGRADTIYGGMDLIDGGRA